MIIGLAGKAGSGKDTVADLLVKLYGFKKTAFAATLKEMLAAAGMPEPERHLKEEPIPGFMFSWRHAAQTLGTEWGRQHLDPDIWLKLTMQRVGMAGDWVISDVRFANEAAEVRKCGVLIHVEGRAADLAGATATHYSESGVVFMEDDLVLDNSGDVDALQHNLTILLGDYFEY